MKKLTNLLLIHWHYFTHERIAFDTLNFLTGKNASGKSTIIDAMQLILLGDTSGSYFNKAANGRGNRTLIGYLKGELGDDEESGFKYLRDGRFTSYIVLEFFDEEKKKSFTAGCCFDVYSANDMQKLFFVYDGPIPEDDFISANTPMNITLLRGFLKERYPIHHSTDVGRDFRTTLYGKMGGLRERFSQLLKKAVSFNPNVDIQQFISEFVCDSQQTVDVSRMQDNIRSYKRLESEADILKERITLLEQIEDIHQKYKRAKQDEQLYAYLIDRAHADRKTKELTAVQNNGEQLLRDLAEIDEVITSANNRLHTMQEERNQLQARLLVDEQAQALQLLDTQIAEKEKQIEALHDNQEKASAELSKYISDWKRNTRAMLQKLDGAAGSLIDPALLSHIQDICAQCRAFSAQMESVEKMDATAILNLGEDGLNAYADSSKALHDGSIVSASRIEDEQSRLSEHRQQLRQEQKLLESGSYRFPQDAIDLKDAITSRLRGCADMEGKVQIVANAAEIKNDRWRNAIEGYLNTQKYYIIVPAEYFQAALQVFDAIKRQKGIYGTGLVDIEKLKRKNPTAEAGSLAEEIVSDDPDVRVFLNYTLGRVHKCDRVSDLRRYRTAVTEDGMLYQNYVVRAMNPKRWAKPAIGQGAIRQRLEDVQTELDGLLMQIGTCSSLKIGLQFGSEMPALTQTQIAGAVFAAKGMAQAPLLERDLVSLRKSRDSIDKSAVDALKERIHMLDKGLKELEKQLDLHKENRSTKRERLRVCQNEKIPDLAKEVEVCEEAIRQNYEVRWIEETGGPRYQRELSFRGNAEDIERAFPRELSRSTNARTAMWEDLRNSRREYNSRYILGYDVKAEDNAVYENALLELRENKLPAYLSRIEDTRKKTFAQFQEDFLSRLQNNISDARRQIDGLNTAIRGSSFGEETFRFRIIPKPEYKRYYDMIVDPMLLDGGYNLLSEQFNAKYKDEIAELFAIITNENAAGKPCGHEDYEKRVQMFTNYKTYLSFDLESVNQEGEAQRLSKTMGKKSGGETQTPFYIAVLASFAQLYRTGRDKTHSTARLIIFDEAFSKMDGERIVKSVALLRQFDFQVILSAPTEKVGDIGTLVDRNLCVLREGKRTCVKAFDPRRAEATADEG